MEHSRASSFSHITLTAVLSVVALIGVGVWHITKESGVATPPTAYTNTDSAQSSATDSTNDPASQLAAATAAQTTTPSDPVAEVSTDALGELVGAYSGLQQQGSFTPESGAQIASSIGMGLQTPITFRQFTVSDIKIDPDTSYAGMMRYRTALQDTLKPLTQHTEPEYEIFGMYIQTKQTKYLDQLRASAAAYALAASSTSAVVVPADATAVDLELINSLNEFSATLDNLADHADDPIASSVLLENYNQGEADVLNAFQALVTYEKNKVQ